MKRKEESPEETPSKEICLHYWSLWRRREGEKNKKYIWINNDRELHKDEDIQAHEGNRSPENFNLKYSSPLHRIKLSKTKTKNFKSRREKKNSLMQGNLHEAVSKFYSRDLIGQERMGRYIQSTERKKLPTRILYPSKLFFRLKAK